MKTVQTAEEFLSELDEKLGHIWTEDDEEICKAFIEFAKLHVQAALEAAAIHTDWDKQERSILNAYPLENIK